MHEGVQVLPSHRKFQGKKKTNLLSLQVNSLFHCGTKAFQPQHHLHCRAAFVAQTLQITLLTVRRLALTAPKHFPPALATVKTCVCQRSEHT